MNTSVFQSHRTISSNKPKTRLKAATQVLELMITPEVSKLFTDNYPDGYLDTTSFSIDESRLYYDCRDAVKFLPYTQSLTELPIGVATPVVQEKVYAGPLLVSQMRSIISAGTASPVAVRMSGIEIQKLLADGFTVTDTDGNTHTFEYCCVVKDDAELKENTEYIVSVPAETIEKNTYQRFSDSGRVLSVDGTPVNGSLEQGLVQFFGQNSTVSPDTLHWAS